MTKDEIKALISAKVAGQGDQVDAGGALAEILNGIIDAIPSGDADAAIVDLSGYKQIGIYDITPEFQSKLVNDCIAVKWGGRIFTRNDAMTLNETLLSLLLSKDMSDFITVFGSVQTGDNDFEAFTKTDAWTAIVVSEGKLIIWEY